MARPGALTSVQGCCKGYELPGGRRQTAVSREGSPQGRRYQRWRQRLLEALVKHSGLGAGNHDLRRPLPTGAGAGSWPVGSQ